MSSRLLIAVIFTAFIMQPICFCLYAWRQNGRIAALEARSCGEAPKSSQKAPDAIAVNTTDLPQSGITKTDRLALWLYMREYTTWLTDTIARHPIITGTPPQPTEHHWQLAADTLAHDKE